MTPILKLALIFLCIIILYYLCICLICRRKAATRIVLSLRPPGLSWRTHMLTVNTTYTVTGVGTLADGVTPGTVDAAMTFTVDQPALGTLTTVDGTHATFVPVAAGTVVITATATAAGAPITGTLSQTIGTSGGGAATQIVLTIA